MAEKKNATKNNYHVAALEKGLEVLEVVSRATEPLSLSQISVITGRTASELFRTLNCLVSLNYLLKEDVSGKYLLTLKLFELSHQHSPVDHLLQAAIHPMQELARGLKESCHLSIIHQNRLLVLAQADSPSNLRISIAAGATFSIVSTVSGRAILSTMPNRDIIDLLIEDPDYINMSENERNLFWERIKTIRATGVSTAHSETYVGIQDTAVLVGSPSSGITAALATPQLTASKTQGDAQRTQESLLACAQRINERAGLNQ